MAQISITEAINFTGKSRVTLGRYIKKGTLPYTLNNQGKKTIDTSDLISLFGEPKSHDKSSNDSLRQHELAVELLKEELRKASEREEWLKEQLHIEQERFKELQQKMLPVGEKEEKKGFFSKIFS